MLFLIPVQKLFQIYVPVLRGCRSVHCTAITKLADGGCTFCKDNEENRREIWRCFYRLISNERFELLFKYADTIAALGLMKPESALTDGMRETMATMRMDEAAFLRSQIIEIRRRKDALCAERAEDANTEVTTTTITSPATTGTMTITLTIGDKDSEDTSGSDNDGSIELKQASATSGVTKAALSDGTQSILEKYARTVGGANAAKLVVDPQSESNVGEYELTSYHNICRKAPENRGFS